MANGEERDPAYDYTEDVIKKLERRLKTEYERAGRSAKRKLEEFMQEFEKKDAEKQREMSYGLIDEDEYNAWRQRQILQAGNYQQMVDVLASDFTHADEQARQIMAGEMPSIYAENFNFATWEAEGYGSIDTSFSLYNRAAVAELALHDADLLPLPSPKRLAELAASDQLWNRQLVSSSMMQSILAGESVPKMATRLATSVGEKNYHSAVRAVRTMSTAVQNKSRIDAFERAKANGSDIQSQIWLAVMDNRTRHAHRQLDHQEVPVGEPFKVDGYELRFPADPEAPAYLKYNCRCSVRGRIKGLEMLADKTLDYSKLGGQSYEEWREGKAKGESQKRIEEGEARARMAKETKSKEVAQAATRPSVDGHIKGISKKGEARADWLVDTLGISSDEAHATLKSIGAYTAEGEKYSEIHRGLPSAQKDIETLDAMLKNPNMPIFDGTIYRGVHVDDSDGLSALEKVEAIISGGQWNESGITSFSSDRRKASQFAQGGAYGDRSKGVNVLIVCKKNETGCPIQHLTRQRPEGEILVPSDIKDRGYTIVSSKVQDKKEEIPQWHIGADGGVVDDAPKIIRSKWVIIEVEENG